MTKGLEEAPHDESFRYLRHDFGSVQRSLSIDRVLSLHAAHERKQCNLLVLGDRSALRSTINLLLQARGQASSTKTHISTKRWGTVNESVAEFDDLQIHLIELVNSTERRKWIHQFEQAGCLQQDVLFVVDLAYYHASALEDNSIGNILPNDSHIRGTESVFESAVKSKWFAKSSVILAMANANVMKQKLSELPLSDVYPEYKGGSDFNLALHFLQDRFLQLNGNGLKVYPCVMKADDEASATKVLTVARILAAER